MITNPITPTFIYVQDSAPTDVTQGKLWYDTINKELYASDGSSYLQVVSSDIQHLTTMISENTLAILEIEAISSIPFGTSGFIVADVFSDANGYLNTINTSATTGAFDTDRYFNLGVTGADRTDTVPVGDTTTYANIGAFGHIITANEDCFFTGADKNSTDATRCVLKTADGSTVLGTANFVGTVATFNPPIHLDTGVSYQVVADSNGASVNHRFGAGVSYPVAGTHVTFTTYVTVSDGTDIIDVRTKAEGYQNKFVQTNAETLNFVPVKFQFFDFRPDYDTGNITFDISFDNGSHYRTGLLPNIEYDVLSNSGSQMILKINLNGTTETHCHGYGLVYW